MTKQEFANTLPGEKLLLKLMEKCEIPAGKACTAEEHFHPYWQMDLCCSGEAGLQAGSRTFSLREGDIVILSPGQSHRFIYPADRSFSCWSFKFEFGKESSRRSVVVSGEKEEKERLALVRAVGELCEACFPPELIRSHRQFVVPGLSTCTGILEGLLAGAIEKFCFAGEEKFGEKDIAGKISCYIAQKGGRPVSVEELASFLHYSPGHLRVLVQERTKMPTKHFIDHCRMEIARELLLYSDQRINELADLMGFADPKYFSRFFRKYTGMAPREFLRQKKNVPNGGK